MPFHLALVAMVFLGMLGVWQFMYPGDDPKGLRYTLWKVGLPTMDVDHATGVMVGDGYRELLVTPCGRVAIAAMPDTAGMQSGMSADSGITRRT